MKSITRILTISAITWLLCACASTPPNPAVGTWVVTIETSNAGLPGLLNLGPDGTGSALIEMPADVGGKTSGTLENIVFDEGNVSFSANLNFAGNPTAFRFNGIVEGDSINGEVNSVLGPMILRGTRQ